MIQAILSVGDNPVYESYPRATDYKIDGEWIGLYDNSNIQVGTINLNNLISIGLTSNLVIFSQKVKYSVESPIDPSKGLMK